MPRRPPPTSLRLVTGPIPSRNTPKHTMPSVPRPVFYPPNSVSRGPAPRPRDPVGPTLDIPFVNCAADSAPSSGGDLSPVSPRSQGGTPRTVRGPWDHSGSIKVALDVEQLLTPLKPVAHA